jgi:FixJ family two-component response regulator
MIPTAWSLFTQSSPRDAPLQVCGSGTLRARFEALTPRERAVCTRVALGKLNKEIAAELGTSERTVTARRAQMMEKMQVTSLAELVHVVEQLRDHSPS